MPYKCPIKRREASKKSAKVYREKNRDRINIIALGRYHKFYKNCEASKEKRKEYLKGWRLANQSYIVEYRATNEDQKQKARIRASKWQKDNVGRCRARNSLRKQRVKIATPDWVSRKELGYVYEKAYQMEKRSGLKHHVDHMVPLVHPDVCGLHVPWNLNAIPALDNLRKGNRI